MTRFVPILLLSLAAATTAAQDGVESDPHSYPRDNDNRNPYVVAGDRAYGRRQDGRDGAVASPRPIAEAIAAYQTASEAPDNLEARWKLLRAFYFKGVYTGQDPEARQAIFARARRVADDAIEILARRVARREGGGELNKMSPDARAEALLKEGDAAPTYFWGAACWGQWALSVGKVHAATAGAAERIRDDAATVIAIDRQFEDGGGYRILGRLHDQAPQIPFVTGWVSREEALRNLRLALSADARNFINRLFLAEALWRGGPEERVEAIRIAENLAGDAPSPVHLVEDLATQEQARRDLEEWRRKSGS